VSAGARFFKLSGGGNDFIVLPALDGSLGEFGGEQAKRLCCRRLSLGADGVVVLRPSERATARFELFNSDGSSAAFSGNGGRCAVRALHELGRASDGSASLETVDDVVSAEIGEGRVGLEISAPRDLRPEVALPAGSPAARGVFAVVGVPYLAVAVADVDELDLAAAAPPLRRLSDFPEGANVAFFVPGSAPLRLRTWERGVEGETLSSGTGCAIVALASALAEDGLAATGARRYELAPRSGIAAAISLEVEARAVRRMVLSGDARLIAEGSLGADAFEDFELP
jgi:diaminopimelate epimerase